MKYYTTMHTAEKYVARVHKPILTKREAETRAEDIRKALVRFYKESRNK